MNQRIGLPDHLFSYLSSITPLVNVDLIVVSRNNNSCLFTWRDDGTYGPGWHIPGGIVRFKESVITRLKAVAKSELEIKSSLVFQLAQINQIMNPTRDYRGHFLSLLFYAYIDHEASVSVTSSSLDMPISWFDGIPSNLIPQHRRYIPALLSFMNRSSTLPSIIGNITREYSEEYETNF